MHIQRQIRPLAHGSAAFSLVETVLALGIMGLAITALLGLLPQGIEMSRQAANTAAETRIVDSIVGQLNAVPYSSLQASNGTELRYDDQGVLVSGTTEDDQSTFVARIVVTPVASGLFLPTLGSSAAERGITRVAIQIAQTPLKRFNFDAAAVNAPRSFTTIPIMLAPMAP